MAPAISAASSALSEADLHKREVVQELVKSENKTIAEFAKHLVTASFSAIAIVLALKEKWLGTHPTFRQNVLIVVALVLFLLASLVGSLAAGIYRQRVSLDDYADIYEELHRVARRRHQLTRLSFGLSFLGAIVITAIVVL